MIPQKLALTSFVEGDTWEGIPSLTITINSAPPAVPLALVTMRFKKSGGLPSEVVELSSADSEITIVSAANWEISIPEQIIPGLTTGKWSWRMKFENTAGEKRTYLSDEITVLETV
jgi:hypothetical protein